MDDEDWFHIIFSILVGIAFTCIIFIGLMVNKSIVNNTTLDAICKDKIPNTEFKQIDDKGNIVCKTLPEMQRLDHTNQFIYKDNGDK